MWLFLFIVFLAGVIYGYLAVHHLGVMAIHYANHIWFGKAREPFWDRVLHFLWIIGGSVVCVLFVSYAFVGGLRFGA